MHLRLTNNIIIYCLIWIILISGYPFVFTYILGYPKLLPMLIATIFLFMFCISKKASLKREYCIMLNIMLLFYVICIIYHSDAVFISNITQIIIVSVILTALTTVVSIEKFIRQYIKFITTIAVLGAIGAIIVFIFNTPYLFQYAQQDERLANAYFLTVSNTPGPPLPHPIIRYSGIFDEPGALAFFCMISLCLNKLYYHSKRIEITLLSVPLLTFSMAYIITVCIYILLFKIKSIKGYILTLSLFFVSITGIYSLKGTEYHQLYTLSIERFEHDDTGDLKGNSRAKESENAKNAFLESPIMGIGIDETRAVNNNYLSILAKYGIIGYILLHIFFIYIVAKTFLSTSCDKATILKCLLILLINLQQRPFNTNVFYFTSIMLLLIYCDIIIRNQKEIQKCYLAS